MASGASDGPVNQSERRAFCPLNVRESYKGFFTSRFFSLPTAFSGQKARRSPF